MFNVTVGMENNYNILVEDVMDNVTVTIQGGLPEGSRLERNGPGAYVFSWTPSIPPNTSLTFVARDTVGAEAILLPALLVCHCFNGGECSLNDIINPRQFLYNLDCACTEGII